MKTALEHQPHVTGVSMQAPNPGISRHSLPRAARMIDGLARLRFVVEAKHGGNGGPCRDGLGRSLIMIGSFRDDAYAQWWERRATPRQ